MPSGRPHITKLFALQAGICPYCAEPMTLEKGKPNSATREHIIPKSQGGKMLVAACANCNHEKGAKPLVIYLACR